MSKMPWSSDYEREISSATTIILHFGAEGRHLAEDRFDSTELCPDGIGGYTVSIQYPEDGWLYGFLLSFGTAVEVLEPEHLRHTIAELATGIAAKYAKDL